VPAENVVLQETVPYSESGTFVFGVVAHTFPNLHKKHQSPDYLMAGKGVAAASGDLYLRAPAEIRATNVVRFDQGIRVPPVRVSADFTLRVIDSHVAVTSTAAARTLTLAPASTIPDGFRVTIKDESGGAATYNITIQRDGSDTIDGGTSIVLATNYGKVTLYSNGVDKWFTL